MMVEGLIVHVPWSLETPTRAMLTTFHCIPFNVRTAQTKRDLKLLSSRINTVRNSNPGAGCAKCWLPSILHWKGAGERLTVRVHLGSRCPFEAEWGRRPELGAKKKPVIIPGWTHNAGKWPLDRLRCPVPGGRLQITALRGTWPRPTTKEPFI